MILSARNLKVRYRNGALGILDVSLELDRGEVIVLFGPNGAGKTTTVRAISGFMHSEGARIVSGTVELFGADTTNTDPRVSTKAGVSFTPERKKVFASMSIKDNLDAIGNRAPRARRGDLLDKVFTLFPVLAERQRSLAGYLSGGQQQMLAIARALMCEAKLIIIDEMTLGLHQSVYTPLFDIVKAIAADGTGVILVDESAHALDVADRCYVLNGGRVRMSGPSEKFLGSELLVAGYVE
jgi:branched-chain amino acid transport system ATP-binding protein